MIKNITNYKEFFNTMFTEVKIIDDEEYQTELPEFWFDDACLALSENYDFQENLMNDFKQDYPELLKNIDNAEYPEEFRDYESEYIFNSLDCYVMYKVEGYNLDNLENYGVFYINDYGYVFLQDWYGMADYMVKLKPFKFDTEAKKIVK